MAEAQSPAVYALVALHAELGGKIKQNAKEAVKLRADMRKVEAVLHLLEPGFNARKISARRKNNPNPLFKRGHLFRAALDVLRASPEPTADEIALALFRSKGVLEPSRDDRRRMYGAINAGLDNHLGKTVAANKGYPRRWSVLGQNSLESADSVV